MTPAELEALAVGLAPVVRELITAAVAPVIARIVALESRQLTPGRDGRDGPQGPTGPPGDPGQRGEIGPPGLQLNAADFQRSEYDGDRNLVLRFGPESAAVELPIRLPIPIYRGVYDEARTYEPADVVTFGGHVWIAKRDTNARPSDLLTEGKSAWTLMAKRGRDGKDGRPGKDTNGKDYRPAAVAR
jgi:hypothetical protein